MPGQSGLINLLAVRRFFAWLCRAGLILANPAADLDLPRKQARTLPKCLSEKEIKLLLAIPNTADPFGLCDRAILELFLRHRDPAQRNGSARPR